MEIEGNLWGCVMSMNIKEDQYKKLNNEVKELKEKVNKLELFIYHLQRYLLMERFDEDEIYIEDIS